MQQTNKQIIPVFFALDDNYVPFFAVAVKSLLLNASKNYFYNIHLLNEGLSEENKRDLQKYQTENSRLIFDDVSGYVEKLKPRLDVVLRDYYTTSIFYRLFIASLYPDYEKAIYLDCDITVIGDISELFFTNLNGNILGVVPDDVIASNPVFQEYAEKGVGVKYDRYFNSGVLLMDLNAYKKERIKEKFIYYLVKYNFAAAAPDQDYLNALCKDKVLYLERGWDRMSTDENYDGAIYLIHYNNFRKPWYYDDVPYARYFWQYAKKTEYYDGLVKIKNDFSDSDGKAHEKGLLALLTQAKDIAESDVNFRTVITEKAVGVN